MSERRSLTVVAGAERTGALHAEGADFAFNYASANPRNNVSLTMPYRARSFVSTSIHPVFAMNLPEGFLRQQIQQRLVRHTAADDFELLSLCGRRQIGRLRFYPHESTSDYGVAQLASEDYVFGLDEVLRSGKSNELFSYLVEQYLDAGVSGVQPKVVVPQGRFTMHTPDMIVKAAPRELPELSRIEFICMEAARLSGIDVPRYWLSDDQSLFVLSRFDQIDGMQLGFEDAAVLLNAPYESTGHYKYTGSYEDVAAVLGRVAADRAGDQRKLFEYIAASVLMRNGDAHLKNFGILYASPAELDTIRLAPLYDVVNTEICRPRDDGGVRVARDRSMALTMAGSTAYPSRDVLLQFATQDCKVLRPGDVLDRISEGMDQSLRANRGLLSAAGQRDLDRSWAKSRRSLSPDRFFGGAEASPKIQPTAAERAVRASRNYDYLLRAFWLTTPDLEAFRLKHGLSPIDAAPASLALEPVWGEDHPAHGELQSIIARDPAVALASVKMMRAQVAAERLSWALPKTKRKDVERPG